MKKLVIGLLAAVVLSSAAGVSYAIHETIPSETQVPLPGADAGKLYEYVTKYHTYVSWELWPGKGRFYKGTEPHGALLTTYVNNKAYFSIGKGKMEDASIIVKENYAPDRKLAALTVMYKIKGFNPEAGDWFWAKYDTGGKVLASGKVDACIGCHGKNRGNDYIMTQKLKK